MDSMLVSDVDCPVCGDDVPVSLPRSAAVVAVETEADSDLDDAVDAVDAEGRTRRLSYSCSAGHPVFVYFEW